MTSTFGSGNIPFYSDIRDLRDVLDREQDAPIDVILTLEKPNAKMLREAVSAGVYKSKHWGRFPRLQIITIEEALAGGLVIMPGHGLAFKQAGWVKKVMEYNRLWI